ncbi:hypothetical protein QQ054_25840 [Oscillatoria amoena NRMC-F 0135]|nr:hypothetical protein [Oscillatoria amoena NRMC-F 0135]
MKVVTKVFILIVMLSSSVIMSYGQGCSDAGFCTMGAMKPDQPFNKKIPIKLRSMEISFYRGTTTLSPIVYVATADASFNIIDTRTSFQIKVPFQAVTGNFGNTNGLGDISLCLTRNLISTEEYDINVSVGGKLPSNNSNLTANFEGQDRPLPMYYQTSLGTYDIIGGISLITRKWLFATGIQHPFNENGNHFRWADWVPPVYNGSLEYVLAYDPCYELKRGTDVMLRAERNFRFSRFNASVGLLPIFRITKDEILNINTLERIKLDGTTGMALSGIVTAGYSFNVKAGIRLLFGHKITQRDVNPDGLTRVMVTTVSYFYRF